MAIWKKLTSAFMSVVLVVGLCPSMAFAEGGGLQAADVSLTTAAVPAAIDYTGDVEEFYKENLTDAFGMYSRQDGSSIKYEDGKIVIEHVTSNKTVYAGFYLNASISDPDTWDSTLYYPANESGWLSLELDPSYAGKAWPVAPIKTEEKGGGTTAAQYYFGIPALEKIPGYTDDTDDDSAIDLLVTSQEAMFKVVNAYIEKGAAGAADLVIALSANGYEQLIAGMWADALESSAGGVKTSWIQGAKADVIVKYIDNKGALVDETDKGAQSKWQFRIPIASLPESGVITVPFVAVSKSKAQSAEKANPDDPDYTEAFYARQGVIDLDAKTAVFGNISATEDYTLSTELESFKVASTVPVSTYGVITANEFTFTPTLTMQDKTYDKLFVGTAEAAAATAGGFVELGEDGSFTFTLMKSLAENKNEIAKDVPVTIAFHVDELDQWVERTFDIDTIARTIAVTGEDVVIPQIEDYPSGVYVLDATVKNKATDEAYKMFNPNAKYQALVTVRAGKATISMTNNRTTYKAVYLGTNTEAADETSFDASKYVPGELEGSVYTFNWDFDVADLGKTLDFAVQKTSDSSWYDGITAKQLEHQDLVLALGDKMVPYVEDGAYIVPMVCNYGPMHSKAGQTYTMLTPSSDGVYNAENMNYPIATVKDNQISATFLNSKSTYDAIYFGGNKDETVDVEKFDESKVVVGTKAKNAKDEDVYQFTLTLSPEQLGKDIPINLRNASKQTWGTTDLVLSIPSEIKKVDLAVKAVMDAIDALPEAEGVTILDKDAIEAARAAYDKLTAEQQPQVSNYAKLVADEKALEELGGVTEETRALIEAMKALPQTYAAVTAENKEQVVKARADYEALSDQQRVYIDEATLDAMVRAEACVRFLDTQVGQETYELSDLGSIMSNDQVIAAMARPGIFLRLYLKTGKYNYMVAKSDNAKTFALGSTGTSDTYNVLQYHQFQIGDFAHGREMSYALADRTSEGAITEGETVTVKVPPIIGTLSEGSYDVAATQTPSSTMRKFSNVSVTVAPAMATAADEDAASLTQTATFTMPNATYDKIYLGTKEQAAAATDGFIVPDGKADGAGNIYTIPLVSMYSPIVISYHASTSGNWTQETVEFVLDDATLALVNKVAELNLDTYFNVVTSQRDTVKAAQDLYAALDDNQKALALNSNYGLIVRTGAMFDVADRVTAAIETLPAAADATAADVMAIAEAKKAFDGMGSSDEYVAVTGNALQNSQIEKLIDQAVRDKLDADLEKAAQIVADAIVALPEPDAVTLADEAEINAAKALFDMLVDSNAKSNDVKSLVNGLTAAEVAIVTDALQQKLADDLDAVTLGDSSIALVDQTIAFTGKAVAYPAAGVTKAGSTGEITYAYYADEACTQSVAAANVKAIGTYYVIATLAADASYKAATSAVAKLTITKGSSTISLAPQTKSYTGEALAYTGTVTKTGSAGKVTYAYYSDSACTKSVAAGSVKAAGTYYVRATVTADDNYEAATSKAAEFTIAKAVSSISLATQSKTYTGKALAYSGKVTKSGSTGKVTYAYYSNAACTKAVKAANVKNAGTYYVKATVAADANYNAATSKAAMFKVAKAANPLTARAATKTVKLAKVKKNAQTVVPITVTKAKGSKRFTVGKWTTASAKKHFSVNKTTGKVTAKKGTPKGTYKFRVKVTAKGNANYNSASKTVAVTIKVA